MRIIFPDITKSFQENSEKVLPNKRYCRWLIVSLLFFIGLGFFMISSITPLMAHFSNGKLGEFHYITREIIFIILGAFGFLFAALFDYKKLQKSFMKDSFFWFTVIMLILVLIFGDLINGAKRWLNFKVFAFQPSELAKLSVIILMSEFLARKQNVINERKNWLMPLCFLGIPSIIILLQKDLGTVFLITAVWCIMLIVAGLDIKIFVKKFLPVAVVLFSIFTVMQSYRVKRMLSYFAAMFDITKAQENVRNAMVAFGSGGIFGKGPGNSDMKLMHIYERHTDFIFAIVGEEFGFFGACLVVVAFALFFFLGFSISRSCKDYFGKYLAFGISLLFAIQAAMNMAMTTGIFPPKGIPLPFISYGGSSLMLSMFMAGILFSIARQCGDK